MRPGSSLSKLKQQHQNLNMNITKKKQKAEIPTREDLIKKRDFSGTITLLDFDKIQNKDNYSSQMWLAYAYFHKGDYFKAIDIYSEWMSKPSPDLMLFTYKACCLYALGKYKEAYSEAEKGQKEDELTNRIKLHCAFKLKIGVAVIDHNHKLTSNVQDQLCLAGLQFMKGEFEEAIEIYKKIYMEKKYDALNIYLAMCYYKLEFFDIALDLVNHYLSNYKTSIVATNLKSAIEYNSSGNCKASQSFILSLQESSKIGNIIENDDLLRHNMAVYDSDDSPLYNKLKVFSSLSDILPEAKLNLIIYYLRNDQVQQAYLLIKDLQPNNTKEYILKAIVHCLLGQQSDKNQEHIKKAQTYFQSIGASSSECDTIEGRQCMASCFRLNGVHKDEIIYLNSIEQYLKDDDDFNWNYGIALAACQNYKESEEVLLRIKKEKYRMDQTYITWLCRVYIMNNKPEYAWNLYISLENHLLAFNLLNFIANEFYRSGNYYFSFKSYLFLEKLTPSYDNSAGKLASASGFFFLVLNNKASPEKLQEIIHYLVESSSSSAQTEEGLKMIKVFMKWGKEKGFNFSDQPLYEGY